VGERVGTAQLENTWKLIPILLRFHRHESSSLIGLDLTWPLAGLPWTMLCHTDISKWPSWKEIPAQSGIQTSRILQPIVGEITF
jgi:hypothetical protein